jgi:uncharacterized peroxidase-related enzyme
MFLADPVTPEALAYLEKDRRESGYVANFERAWAWRPDIAEAFGALRQKLMDQSSLTPRETALIVCATVGTLGDSYCSLAWGGRLAALAGPVLAAEVLRGAESAELTARESALLRWARQLVRDPNGATSRQVEELRMAGLSDREIFEATVFTALRLAFSTVNDGLGARPDSQLAAAAPPEVRAAVSYGRVPD